VNFSFRLSIFLILIDCKLSNIVDQVILEAKYSSISFYMQLKPIAKIQTAIQNLTKTATL